MTLSPHHLLLPSTKPPHLHGTTPLDHAELRTCAFPVAVNVVADYD